MRKLYASQLAAERDAEAVARAYAADIGKPYPIPPDRYGPGRQPEPREAYYQRRYRAVRAPDATTTQYNLQVDATMQAMQGRVVPITDNGGGSVTLDFTGLVPDAIATSG